MSRKDMLGSMGVGQVLHLGFLVEESPGLHERCLLLLHLVSGDHVHEEQR